MTNRQICHWMVLTVFIASFLLCQSAFAQEKYRIKHGDTLAGISKKLHVSIKELRDANHLRGSALKVNGTLFIPTQSKVCKAATSNDEDGTVGSTSARYYTIKNGDSLYALAKETGVSVGEIKRLNHLGNSRLHTGQKILLPETKTVETIPDEDMALADTAGTMTDQLGDDATDSQIDVGSSAETDNGRPTGSDLFGKWDNLVERQLLVKVAKGFINAPYRLGGSSVRGIDCSGFVRKIYDMFNIILPRTAREQSRVGKYVSRGELQEGDLVFFHTRRSIGHVGIYIGNDQFVHAASGHQRMVRISSLAEPYYSKHYVKAVRLKDLDKEI